jgi:mannose-phosphate isomerase/GDPmannose pyrophosphorylase family protein
VDTGDALLICRRGESQKVREVVAALSGRKRDDTL